MAQSAINLYLQFESGLIEGVSAYLVARKQFLSQDEWNVQIAQLALSTTVYIGNLSFMTTEDQIYKHFSQAGLIRRVIMGTNRKTLQACGFAFVQYYHHQSALNAKAFLHKSVLDGRNIKVDIDRGYAPERCFGKAESGGQIRDNLRKNVDQGRGGYSARLKRQAKAYNLDKDAAAASTEGGDQPTEESNENAGTEQGETQDQQSIMQE